MVGLEGPGPQRRWRGARIGESRRRQEPLLLRWWSPFCFELLEEIEVVSLMYLKWSRALMWTRWFDVEQRPEETTTIMWLKWIKMDNDIV